MDEIRARQIPAEVFQRYQTLRQSYAALAQKITELDVDKSEHEYVLGGLLCISNKKLCSVIALWLSEARSPLMMSLLTGLLSRRFPG